MGGIFAACQQTQQGTRHIRLDHWLVVRWKLVSTLGLNSYFDDMRSRQDANAALRGFWGFLQVQIASIKRALGISISIQNLDNFLARRMNGGNNSPQSLIHKTSCRVVLLKQNSMHTWEKRQWC
jgi:hypothetical protein